MKIQELLPKKRRLQIKLFVMLLLSLPGGYLRAQVKYDEGARTINGVQILQDKDDATAFYYLPQYPKLAMHDDGSYELLCMKYVGEKGEPSGGLFHALIEFKLPDDTIAVIERKLQKEIPGAHIMGPVRMTAPKAGEGAEDPPSFEIVSAILSNKDGKDAFTKSVVSSGFAPLTPGSKAAVAALLDQQGTTLLWNSLSSGTSDVSISIKGSYEAYVKGYNATVTAEVSNIYEHFSKLSSDQEGFTKDQTRNIIDQLHKDNKIKIDVFDRSAGLGIKTGDMDGILKLVTDKLLELIFDSKTGWAKDPQREVAVEGNQVPGRQERGYFWQVFGGAEDQSYITDHQYVLKRRKDIQVNTFYLNLSKATTIQVPFNTTGNIAGLYKNMADQERYFKTVNMSDPDFQQRSVLFQLNGETADAFNELINYASVSFKKTYNDGRPDVTGQIIFQASDVKEGKNLKDVLYPRLGIKTSDWLDYEYKIDWSVKGAATPISYPKDKTQWMKASDNIISLSLPFRKNTVELDATRQSLNDSSIASAVVTIAGMVNGQQKQLKKIILRPGDTESVSKFSFFNDDNTPVAYTVKWYHKNGKTFQQPIKQLDVANGSNGYLLVMPPAAENFN